MQLKSFIKKDLNLVELFKGGAIALFFKFASVIIGYFFFWYLAQLVGAEGVGVFSTGWTILMIGTVFGKLGFDTSIVKFLAESMGKQHTHHIKPIYKHCILIVLASSTLVAIILVATALPISQLFFKNTDYASLIRIVGISVIPLSLMNYNAESMKGLKKITAFSLFQNGSIYVLTLLIIWIFSFHSVDNTTSIYSLLLAIIVLLIISFWAFQYYLKRIPRPQTEKPKYKFELKSILNITLPMMLTNSLFLIMSWMDILMLSAFKTQADVGIYNTALKIAACISITLVAISSIAAPKIAELHGRNDTKGFRRFVKQTSFLNFSISLPIFLVIILFPGFLLGIFGQEFTTGASTLIILAIGQVFGAFSGATIHILNMTGYEKISRNILLSTATINLILNYILVPRYGMTGAAIATSISTILWNLLSEIVIYQKFRFLTYPLISLKKAMGIKNDIMKPPSQEKQS
ncbi:MAG: flippase [Bacteroidota bacterium]|nr:flippase [Bacteroidota bacterium]